MEERKRVLRELVPKPVSLDGEQLQNFNKFLESHHEAFSLEPQERGETHLVEMEISTGNAEPVKQGMRRMPFAIRVRWRDNWKTCRSQVLYNHPRALGQARWSWLGNVMELIDSV